MSLQKYIGKQIIAWLSYNPVYEGENTVCYVYPRFYSRDNNYYPIDSADFPKQGRIEVRIKNGKNAEEVYEQFGSLVNIRINEDKEPYYGSNNYYSLNYSYVHGKLKSSIWIEKFTSNSFFQVIEIGPDDASIVNAKDNEISIPEYSFTNQICLRKENKIFGPFVFEEQGDSWALSATEENNYLIGEYDASYLNDELCVVEDNDNCEAAILLPKSILQKYTPVVSHDWIADRDLIDVVADVIAKGEGTTKRETREAKELIQKYLSNNKLDTILNDKQRVERVQKLLQSQIDKEGFASSIVDYALSDDQLKSKIINDVINTHFDEIKGKIPEYALVKDRLDALRNEEAAAKERVEKLKEEELVIRENAEIQAPKERQQESTANALISSLEQQIESLRNDNSDLQQKYDYAHGELETLKGSIKKVEQLKQEIEKYTKERNAALDKYNQQVIDNDKLKEQFKATISSFNDEAKRISKVIDNKILETIIRGIDGDSAEEPLVPFDKSLLEGDLSAPDIIQKVKDYITGKAHRDVTDNNVANYLICISQGFITTFAGEPGTGKTSLCNILAKSLGLVTEDEKQKRFIDVPVERGWTSIKDFIGYYNPLTKSMEKSNSEVYAAFERLDHECGNTDEKYSPEDYAPFVVLLDEANLSPIEHYWAAFLKNCDFDSTSNRTISLGGNCKRKLPEHLRFLATVNFDHTTEELSPRFLDRSWVITLEPSGNEVESAEELINSPQMVTFGSLKRAFTPNENEISSEDIRKKWDKIKEVFKINALPIMPRNLKMVKDYCIVACQCMSLEGPKDRFAPIDYALSQKILPTINGSGEKYDKLIKDLLEVCPESSMPISNRHLKRMKEAAEGNMGFYQFFAR